MMCGVYRGDGVEVHVPLYGIALPVLHRRAMPPLPLGGEAWAILSGRIAAAREAGLPDPLARAVAEARESISHYEVEIPDGGRPQAARYRTLKGAKRSAARYGGDARVVAVNELGERSPVE